VAAVLIFGTARLAIPQPGPQVKVGLVASDVNEEVAQPGAATERLFQEYMRAEDVVVKSDCEFNPTDAVCIIPWYPQSSRLLCVPAVSAFSWQPCGSWSKFPCPGQDVPSIIAVRA
jgi:hypothetical protein